MEQNVLEFKNIVKQYAGVRALGDVSFNIKKGVCHCIVGENGAGKSTLIKILTGAEKRTSGTILYNGNDYSANSTRESMKAGIGCLFQELNVIEQLRVHENISLGMEDTKFGLIRKGVANVKVKDILERIEPSISMMDYVSDLSVAKRQIIEIVKAISTDADIIIMDEPTAALSEEEVRRLFEVIDELKKRNVTIIYISHRLDEIFEIGDYVTVLRDGKHIDTKPMAEVGERQDLIKMMIGKVIVEDYVPSDVDHDSNILEVKNFSNHKLKDVSFDLKKGEILGFYGLIGAGKTEIARAIYGADERKGTMLLEGEEVKIKNPNKAIKSGIGLIPEERRTQGLCTRLTIADNTPMMKYDTISKFGFANEKKIKQMGKEYIEKIKIACRDEDHVTARLSGGNQQKVVFAKLLNADTKVLLLDEPTRGVDVGAKQEIYSIVRELSQQGRSVIVFSSELPEIINLCDRIILLYEGEVKAVLQNGEDIDSREILHLVTGGN